MTDETSKDPGGPNIPPHGLAPLRDTSESLRTTHYTHALPNLLQVRVRSGHLTAERANALTPGINRLNHEDALFTILAMGTAEGDSYTVEQLSEFDWRVLRGLVMKRRVEIVEVLGIQYVSTRDLPRTVRWLRDLGLLE